jgi:membrane protease YdiL (CAAX protease family)
MSTSDDTAADKLESICPGCGERNPPQFALCWNCGASLENAEKAAAVEEPDEDDADQVQTLASDNPFGRWTGWYELVAVVLATFVYHVLAQSLIGVNHNAAAYFVAIPRYAGWSLLLWILIRRDRSAVQPVSLRECRWLSELVFAVLIVAVNWLLSYAIAIFAHEVRLPQGNPPAYPEITGVWPWNAFCVALFFGAAYEELLYRVYIQSKLESLLGNSMISIVISAIIFAVNHGYPPASTLRVFAVGMMYGTIYCVTRKMPRLVLGHWMHNILVAVLSQH